VFGDKVWVPFSNYGTNGVTLGGGDIYKDATENDILCDAVITEADLSGLGGSDTAPYTFPTASTATLNRYTSVTINQDTAQSTNYNQMDIRVEVVLASATPAAVAPQPAANGDTTIQLKAINGAGTGVTGQDVQLNKASTALATTFTFERENVDWNTAYGYGLYFEGVESTNDGARIVQNVVGVILPLYANGAAAADQEIFGAIPGQKLTNTPSGIKSNPLLIGINIKEWSIESGGTNLAKVKVEWYGSVSVVSGSTITVKNAGATSFTNNADCTGGTVTEVAATLITTSQAAIQEFSAPAGTNGHAVALDDTTGVTIANTGNTNPVTDPTYSTNYPVKLLNTANWKTGGKGKCSDTQNTEYILA
jgi:hypothetical protein